MIDLLHEIWQTMRTNKLRTILTGIAVSWGVFMLIVLLSMARGVTNSFEHDIMSSNTALLTVYGGMTSMPYHGNREGRYIQFKRGDMPAIESSDRQRIEAVSSRMYGGGAISTPKATVSQQYEGVYPMSFSGSALGDIIHGRYINQRDMDEKAKVMVIPQYYAEQLFPPHGKGAYGGRVDCNGLSFKVVGIYDSRWNRSIYIPYTTAMVLSSDKNDLGRISVEMKDVRTENDALAVEANVRNTLSRRHDFNPNDPNAVYVSNSFINSLKANIAMLILNTSVWVLGTLTLLTGIVGIGNIMFVTVKERTHEIGIRRAIGAKPRQILTQVVAESIAITVVFGYIGIVLGTAVTQVIAHFIGDDGPLRNPTVSLSIAFEVTLFLVFAGALAGLFPALRALKIKPVEALRDE